MESLRVRRHPKAKRRFHQLAQTPHGGEYGAIALMGKCHSLMLPGSWVGRGFCRKIMMKLTWGPRCQRCNKPSRTESTY